MKVFRAFVLIAVVAFASLISAQLPPIATGEVLVTAFERVICIGAATYNPYQFIFYRPDGGRVTDDPAMEWHAPDPLGGVILTGYSPVLRQFVVVKRDALQRITSNRTFETLSTATPFNPSAMALNAQGEIYVIGSRGGLRLWRFSADGSLLQDNALALPPIFVYDASMDLAQDGCTAIIAARRQIARHDVCTNTRLPDFASSLPYDVTEARYLPSGDVLVATPNALVQLNPTGTPVRTYPMPPGGAANLKFAFDPTGTSVWIRRSPGCGGAPLHLLRVDLATGNVLSTTEVVETNANVATSVSVLGEWRAASDPAAIPKVVRRRAVR